jgi:curli biogenesis system outer membrane secretion channel CsgG
MKTLLPILAISILLAGCSSTAPVVYRSPSFDNQKTYRVAVLPLTDAEGHPGSGETFANLFESALLASGKVDVVERTEIDRVLRERRADPSADFGNATAASKVLKSDPVIVGRASDVDKALREQQPRPDSSAQFEDPVALGKLVRADLVIVGKVSDWAGGNTGLLGVGSRKTTVGASVRAISVEKGTVVWSVDKAAEPDFILMPLDAPVDVVARKLCRQMVAAFVGSNHN